MKKFKIGKWYVLSTVGYNEKAIVCYQGKNKSHYGFNFDLEWTTSFGNAIFNNEPKNVREATDKEVEEALIKEAKRRGYATGNFRCLLDGKKWGIECGSANYSGYEMFKGRLYWNAGVCFKNGKWAEIIDESTEEKENQKMLESTKYLNYEIY